jgi:hypothetical protein
LIANVANGVLAVIGSSICLFFLMDRVPRRKPIIGGFIATSRQATSADPTWPPEPAGAPTRVRRPAPVCAAPLRRARPAL